MTKSGAGAGREYALCSAAMPATEFSISCFARLLCVHSHNLDAIRMEVDSIIELEVDVLDYERPNFVAEAVGIKMALQKPIRNKLDDSAHKNVQYLEAEASLDLLCENL